MTSEILAFLDNKPSIGGSRLGLSPAVAAERKKESARRHATAQQRAYQALARAYPDDFRALYDESRRRILAERGPLPGDPA